MHANFVYKYQLFSGYKIITRVFIYKKKLLIEYII